MFTTADLYVYQQGCLVGQPRTEVNHPNIGVVTAMAYPPEYNPEWVIEEEEE